MKELPQVIVTMLFGWLVFNFVVPLKIVTTETTAQFGQCPIIQNATK